MPTPKVFDAAKLVATGARLTERADQITQITLQELAEDLRVAARCCDALALIRAELSETISQAAPACFQSRLPYWLSTEALGKSLRVFRVGEAEHHEVAVIALHGVRERRRR
jgi:hypothetical protein